MTASSYGAERLERVLSSAREERRAALVGYLPVGFPDVELSLEAMTALVESGCDVVEIGFPYSDPVLDGPVIQDAAACALRAGVRTSDIFRAVRAVVAAGGTAVVMSYWNPILRYGVERFAADLAAAGGSGVITPDLIPDEAEDWSASAERHGLCPIFLIAPSSTDERIAATTARCRGFVYVASVMGVTGTRTAVGSAACDLVDRARRSTGLPLCVGLGVSNGAQAAEMASYADGVIVGSALVKKLASDAPWSERLMSLQELTGELRAGVREGNR
ncbi:tryptophan synthase, alpha chain [Austwickia chelonae]|uniref:Tryptophan synthase alpha chain n=1 Tax=Austwickia chelonae NBRC 105200 TaxID=1184607 RepID=K6W5Z1_9MICO|nr:tryptophan synthase subunit alpha [Austwickia chelonae]GAB77242.1 tryptophan synthase alpha chain [Austwickia chelonae NBRC 105200]SEW05967.1 tryptophan synthase, alpha chain [Austwickia chelonae]